MNSEISVRELILDEKQKFHEISLTNGQLTIVVHDFGARLHQLFIPDKSGKFENILLSKDDPFLSYHTDSGYYGLICGPVAGRIKGAHFGNIQLEANENGNLLHSGEKSWERQLWNYQTFSDDSHLGIKLMLTDDQSGFPGPIQTSVIYSLVGNCLEVKMAGKAEQATLYNPAWHPYFNLSGDKKSTLNHILSVQADRLVEVNIDNIPTGRLLGVDGTVYDLRKGSSIADILETKPTGFDNCFVFPSNLSDKKLTLFDPESGRKLTCLTDRQSVVIYTATNPEQTSMISGRKMFPNRGIAIEFQELPDIVHHPEWGSIVIKENEEKVYTTTYEFSVD